MSTKNKNMPLLNYLRTRINEQLSQQINYAKNAFLNSDDTQNDRLVEKYDRWNNQTIELLRDAFDTNDFANKFENKQVFDTSDNETDPEILLSEFKSGVETQINFLSFIKNELRFCKQNPLLLPDDFGHGRVSSESLLYPGKHAAKEAIKSYQENNWFRKCENIKIQERYPLNSSIPNYEILCSEDSFLRTQEFIKPPDRINKVYGCDPNCYYFKSRARKIFEDVVSKLKNKSCVAIS